MSTQHRNGIDIERLKKGSINVEPLSHKTFLYAFNILETLYGGGKQNLHEITLADAGVVVYDGPNPVGTCMVKYGVALDHPHVMNCCILEEYKGTKWAIRLLRELKKMVRSDAYYIIYAGEDSPYKGKIDSIKTIVATKGIRRNGIYTLIRNR